MCVPSFSQRRVVAAPLKPILIHHSNELLYAFPAGRNKLDQSASSVPASPPSPTEKHNHIIVKHDYHDRANALSCAPPSPEAQPFKGGVAIPFPPKLHEMLDKVEEEGLEHIVSWQPHGRCFVVHDPKGFVDLVLPKYFKQSKLASFQRQLNLYGFQRLTKGNDKGGYYHEYFLRGRQDLCAMIHRMKVKGTGVRARSNPDAEPDFWKMSWITKVGAVERPKNDESDVTMSTPVTSPVIKKLEAQVVKSTTATASPTSSLADLATLIPPDLNASDVLFFEGRSFHAVEAVPSQVAAVVEDDNDELDSEEMESLLADVKLPQDLFLDIIDTIDDDAAFGDLLERLIDEK